jgi:hypothetical protein
MTADTAFYASSSDFQPAHEPSTAAGTATAVKDEIARIALADRLFEGKVEGAWWPRSRDVTTELRSLLAALPERLGRITRVALNSTMWDATPRRVLTPTRIMKVGWFTVMDPHLMTLADAQGHRIDLLIIPPQTAEEAAQRALAIASGISDMTTEQILESSEVETFDPSSRTADQASENAVAVMASP